MLQNNIAGNNMFIEIPYTKINKHTLMNDFLIDTSDLNLADSKFFDKHLTPDNDEKSISQIYKEKLLKIVYDNSYIQESICRIYFFKFNCNITLTDVLYFSGLHLSAEDIILISKIFKTVIFNVTALDEKGQNLQVTGLSNLGNWLVHKIFEKNDGLNNLYNRKIISDNNSTKFYLYKQNNNAINDTYDTDIYIKLIETLFLNNYFRKFGKLNVSTFTMNELKNHIICNEILKRVDQLYLMNYDLEFNSRKYFVKFLVWY